MLIHETTSGTARTVSWLMLVLMFPLSLTMHFYVKPASKAKLGGKRDDRLAGLQRRIESVKVAGDGRNAGLNHH